VEKIGEQVWIAGNFKIQITKVLNAEAEKTEDPEWREENPFRKSVASAPES
jgi:hypothetical protein